MSGARIEEVPMKIYCISSATKNIVMEVPQKISIYTLLVALAYNGISIKILLNAPDLEYIFSGTWSWNIFLGTSYTRTTLQ